MPTDTLYAATQGDRSGWTLGAGASKPVAVQSDDDDTSYIHSDQTGRNELYHFDELTGEAVEVTTWTWRGKTVSTVLGSRDLAPMMKWDGTEGFGTTFSCPGSASGYQWETEVDPTIPKSGDGTDPQVHRDMQVGIYYSSNSNDDARCTALEWKVTYIVEGGGFLYLLSSFIPPIAAVGSSLSNFELMSMMPKHRKWSFGDELEELKRFFEVRPAYSFSSAMTQNRRGLAVSL